MRLAWLALLLLFGAWAHAQSPVEVPALGSRVTDLTRTLSSAQVAALEAKLATFEARKGSQVAVLMLPTTRPEAIEQYAIRVAEAWKIGRKKIDDGVILIVAKDDRTLRIEVGYGLEGALPDAIAKRIVSDIIVPRFREGDYAGGIEAGVDRIIRVIDGEPLPPPASGGRSGEGGTDFEQLFVIAIVGAAVAGGILRAVVGKGPAAGIVGFGVGIIAWAMSGALLVAFGAALVALLFTLFGGGGGGFGGRRRGGWSGGGGGWSSGGGGGWGGGGGGGFGGGGASGRW